MATKRRVLFVCLGNICRSPMAEIVFRAILVQRGVLDSWEVDSAGTSAYHIGEHPDQRSVETCSTLLASTISEDAHKHFKSVKLHRARQLSVDDFKTFDYIFAMDAENLKNINKLYNQHVDREGSNFIAKIERIGEYHTGGRKNVEDPYYGNMSGFKDNYNQILDSCNIFLDTIYK